MVSGAPAGTFNIATRVTGFASPASVIPTDVASDGTGFTFVSGTNTAGSHPLSTTDPADALCTFLSLNAAGTMTLDVTSGPTSGGTTVALTGTGTFWTAGSTVTVGGAAATASFTDATHITITTPPHATIGAVDVVVSTPDAFPTTATGAFTYTSTAPTVTSVSPSSGTTAGGTAVTITGTGFVSGATVTFGGAAATSVAFVNATTLTAVTPFHVVGAVNVVVTNPDLNSGTGTNKYTYVGGTVTVSSVSPASGPSAGGTAVTITGTGFASGATVTFGGAAATSVVFGNSTTLTAVTPAHAAGAVNVVVTNPDLSSGTGTNKYTYVGGVVTVTGVSPSSGSTAGGTAVIITGTGFASGASVTFGGSAATSVVVGNSTTLTAVTPAHAAGLVSVVVTNTDLGSGTGTNLYTYVGPTVTSVSPSSGTTSGGTGVTITGTGFVSGATVTFGGSSATSVVFISSTTLTAVTPAHAAGAVNVVVTNPDLSVGIGTNLYTYSSGGLTVTINQASGQADPTNTSPINFTVVFSLAVANFTNSDVTITGTAGGTKSVSVTPTSGSSPVYSTYNVAVSGMTTTGTVIASIPAGVATNGALTNQASTSTDNSVTWSGGGPTVTINQASGQPDPTNVSPIRFTVVFSASVTGFTTGDVTITGTAGGTKTATVSGSGTTYTVSVTGMTTGGTVIATVPAGVAVDSSNRSNVASTSTDNTVTWTAASTTITLTTSAPLPPGAHDPVITWGQGFFLGVRFSAYGASKTVALQGTRDGTAWATITNLTMNSSGYASFFYTPITNLYYRAVFSGTPDLGAATSNQVRTVVREIAVLRPTNSGAIKSIPRNRTITFTTTVRPSRPELQPATVTYWVYRKVSGAWQLYYTQKVSAGSTGIASFTWTFSTSGLWYVRSMANPTPYNANSAKSPTEQYRVS